MTGKTISHYKILEKLGGGGMGVVYKAEDTRLKRFVALKFLPPELTRDEEAKQRFINEAQAASALDHPNICVIHEIDETDDGQIFIAMAYYEGETLQKKVISHQLPVTSAIDIAIQIAQGLAKAHEHGITHRDIKPANVIVIPNDRDVVKIIDFGLSKLLGAKSLTKSGVLMGTVAYMSPEQAEGKIADHGADIWALGVILYEMLAGQLPFQGESAPPMIYAILNEEPEFRPNLPAALESIVKNALQKNRRERYQRMDEMLADLQAIRRELELGSTTAGQTKTALRRKQRLQLFGSLAGLFVLVLGIAFTLWQRAGTVFPESHRIAVLPMLNISADAKDEYFADGMTEELISTLSKIGRFRVIARTSVMRYKGGTQDIAAIGRELKVGTILESSVRKANGKLRITAQLVDVRRQEPFWSRDYDRELEDVFAIQCDIAQRVAEALQAELPSGEKKRIEKKATENFAAYTSYLQGRFFWNKRTPEDFKKSIAHFEQAIAHDPNYALAYAGLADAYAALGGIEYGGLPAQEAMSKAKTYATRALAFDEQCAEARAGLANILFNNEWNWSGAEREFKRTITLNPNYAMAHHWYAHLLAAQARFDEARAEIKIAQELDPLSPIINTAVGMVHYYARQSGPAIAQLRQVLEMDPSFVPAMLQLGVFYAHEQRFDEAIAEYQKTIGITGERPIQLALLGHAYAASGRRSEALKMLTKLQQSPAQLPVSPLHFVLIYLGLGEKDRAFEWLEKACEERSNYLTFLKVEPLVDSLRLDPRFEALLRKVGLEKA